MSELKELIDSLLDRLECFEAFSLSDRAKKNIHDHMIEAYEVGRKAERRLQLEIAGNFVRGHDLLHGRG